MTLTDDQGKDFEARMRDMVKNLHSENGGVMKDSPGTFHPHESARNQKPAKVYGHWCDKTKVFLVEAVADDGELHDEINGIISAIKRVRQKTMGSIIGYLEVNGTKGEAVLSRSPVENTVKYKYNTKKKNLEAASDDQHSLFIFVVR